MAASKRKRGAAFDDEPAKSAAKRPPTTKPLASIFAKPAPLTWRIRDDDGLYHLVYGNPEARDKVAIFDLDDCLTKRLPKTALCAAPWKWMYEDIPKALREAEKAGFGVFIVSNQGGAKTQLKGLRVKFEQILTQLAIPCHFFAATSYDFHRKPMPGIFEHVEAVSGNIDKQASLFVGDAAGRLQDHSDSDRKWAMNVGLPFQTPEQYFHDEPAHPFKITGFDAKAYVAKRVPLFSSANTPLVYTSGSSTQLDVVVCVGQRTSGMTTCYEQHFSSHSYVRIENKLVDASITGKIAASLESGRSVFIEDVSSNRIDGRKRIADIARRHGARCRILRFSLSEMHAWHNNLYRHLAAPLPPDTSRSPLVAPSEYVAVQEPTPNEGFHEIKTYSFVFSGTTEERERYSLWLGLNRAETKALEGRQKSGYSR